MVDRPRSVRSSEISRPTVSKPACTQTWAIPAPMVPSPTTPTRRIPTGGDPTAGSAAGAVQRGDAVGGSRPQDAQDQVDHNAGIGRQASVLDSLDQRPCRLELPG